MCLSLCGLLAGFCFIDTRLRCHILSSQHIQGDDEKRDGEEKNDEILETNCKNSCAYAIVLRSKCLSVERSYSLNECSE